MACQTCDHTMQRVNDGNPRVFWCPRCGTLKTEDAMSAPKVVARACALCATIDKITNDEHPNVDALEYLLRAVRECIST